MLSHRRAVMIGRKGGRATARMHAAHRRAGRAGAKARYHIPGKAHYSTHHQTGTSSYARDKRIKALHPGRRITVNGRVYYEYRKNRSDVNRTRRV